MIQIAHFNTDPIKTNDQLQVSFLMLNSSEEAAHYIGPLMLGLDDVNFEGIKKIIIEREQQVILVLKNKQDFKLVPEMKSIFPKIFGFIDLSAEYEVAIPLVRNYLNLNFTTEALQLEKLSSDLTQIEERTHSELRGIKELHDRFVKMRTEKIKGAELSVKFMAGEKSGGEFFDYIVQDNHMLFIQAGSDSYVMSSLIISAMEELKLKKSDFYETIESFIASLKFLANEHNAKLNYTILILKIKNMEATIFSQGNSKIYYNKEILTLGKSSIIKLHRGAQITFLSEGTLLNWKANHDEKKLCNFLNSNLEMSKRDFINEIFFELSRHKKGMFFNHDALVALLEINENVLLQL
jgi:hypothetical protein